MPFEPRTTPFRPGEMITADRLNSQRAENAQLARYFAENFRLPADPRRGLPAFVRHFVGIVQSGPPAGGADYTDARYYVTAAAPNVSLGIGDLFAATAESTPGLTINVTATNLAELPVSTSTGAGTHLVPAQTYVHVFGIRTRDQASTPGTWQYFFYSGFAGATLVLLTGAAAGGGWYTGVVLTPPTAASDPTTAVTSGTFGAAGATVYLANTVEQGGGHGLDTGGTVFPMVFLATPIAPTAAGVPCYAFQGIQPEPCTT